MAESKQLVQCLLWELECWRNDFDWNHMPRYLVKSFFVVSQRFSSLSNNRCFAINIFVFSQLDKTLEEGIQKQLCKESQLGEPDSVISRKMVVLDLQNGGTTHGLVEVMGTTVPGHSPLQVLLNLVADKLYSHHFRSHYEFPCARKYSSSYKWMYTHSYRGPVSQQTWW